MSILIRGMKMPTVCDRCFALDEHGDYPRCLITDEQRGYNFRTREKRMDKCPLVPVPPHGDLIDRDGIKWIEEEFEEQCHNDRWTVVEKIAYKAQVDKLPTVIPADKEVNDDIQRN